jgi:hypothetical protein
MHSGVIGRCAAPAAVLRCRGILNSHAAGPCCVQASLSTSAAAAWLYYRLQCLAAALVALVAALAVATTHRSSHSGTPPLPASPPALNCHLGCLVACAVRSSLPAMRCFVACNGRPCLLGTARLRPSHGAIEH